MSPGIERLTARASVPVAMLIMLLGCQAEPPPVCVAQRATGWINYLAQYTNMEVTSADPAAPDCALFIATVPPKTWNQSPGVPNYGYPTLVSALGGQLGGQPFRLGVIGVDEFVPTAVGERSLVSIAPDILGGTIGAGTPPDGGTLAPGTAYGIGALEAETPDLANRCYVKDFSSFSAPVDWGADVGVRDVTFHFTSFVLHVTAAVPGTQFQANAEVTIGACRARFVVIAYAPAATCATVHQDSTIAGPAAGVQPLTGADVDPALCARSSQDPSDPQWGYYTGQGFTAGDSVNPNFPITCDVASGFCALPIPPAPDIPTVPIASSTPRP